MLAAALETHFQRRQERVISNRLGHSLIDRDGPDHFAGDLADLLGAGQVKHRAMVVGIHPFAAAVVRKAGYQEKIILAEIQRTQDRRKLRERPGLLHPP